MPSISPLHDALFLDFDGTLVDIAPTPDSVRAPEGLVATLRALPRRFGGAVAIITGRRIADIDRYLGPLDLPVVGVHGAQVRLNPREPVRHAAAPMTQAVAQAIEALVVRFEGVWIERKESALTLHMRACDAATSRACEDALRAHVEEWGEALVVAPGRKVLEIVPRGFTKAVALEALTRTAAFAGRAPVMVGDDYSDALAMAKAEQLGGRGLRVAGEHFAAADADFADPAALRAWLAALVRQGEGAQVDP